MSNPETITEEEEEEEATKMQENLHRFIVNMDSKKIDPESSMNHVHPEVQLFYGKQLGLLPKKSKDIYQNTYDNFIDWLNTNVTQNNIINEDNMILYLEHMSSLNLKPPTLWSRFSMLTSTIYIKHNIDISHYYRVKTMLKNLQVGYKPNKTNFLTPKNVLKFVKYAPDVDYLFTKVVIIFIVKGGFKKNQLKKLTIENVMDINNELIVKTANKIFSINGIYYDVVRKYMDLRPKGVREFFLNYRHGKCTEQVAGINKVGRQTTLFAQFLQIQNPDQRGRYPRQYGFEAQIKNLIKKKNKSSENDSNLYVHNNFEASMSNTYEQALETIGNNSMTDESQVFCNFVANEMRDIINPELRQQMKKQIQKTVLEFLEKDAKLCDESELNLNDDETLENHFEFNVES